MKTCTHFSYFPIVSFRMPRENAPPLYRFRLRFHISGNSRSVVIVVAAASASVARLLYLLDFQSLLRRRSFISTPNQSIALLFLFSMRHQLGVRASECRKMYISPALILTPPLPRPHRSPRRGSVRAAFHLFRSELTFGAIPNSRRHNLTTRNRCSSDAKTKRIIKSIK